MAAVQKFSLSVQFDSDNLPNTGVRNLEFSAKTGCIHTEYCLYVRNCEHADGVIR